MELILFAIGYILFWCIYYYIEGLHDVNMILWKQIGQKSDKSHHEIFNEHRYCVLWHKYDSYEKMLVHLFLPLISLYFGAEFWYIIGLILLSVSVRLYVHSMVINKNMAKPLGYIGTTDWFDIFLTELEQCGMSQWTFKGIICIISIIITIIGL